MQHSVTTPNPSTTSFPFAFPTAQPTFLSPTMPSNPSPPSNPFTSSIAPFCSFISLLNSQPLSTPSPTSTAPARSLAFPSLALANLTYLTVSNVPVKASGPYVVLAHMKKLKTLTISHANLTGYLPTYIHSNLTHVDFSGNQLKGNIPTSITMLDSLESLILSSNGFKGEIPSSLGGLISLKNLSLASNSFSGSIPDSISTIPSLVHMDLSSNQFNGTIPKFISEMRNLEYLNLANNSLRGVVPFNSTFIKRLAMFKVGGNSNLCYNHSVLSSKLKLEIAPCDKYGMPMSPPPAKDSSAYDSSGSDYNDIDYDDGSIHKKVKRVGEGDRQEKREEKGKERKGYRFDP